MKRRSCLRALGAASVLAAATMMTAPMAMADAGTRGDREPNAHADGRSDGDDGHGRRHGHSDLEELANRQTALYFENWTSTTAGAPMLPVGCDHPQPVRGVFILPVNNQTQGAGSATCTVRAGQKLLVDLGGAVLYEDANGETLGFPVDGENVAFSKKNLERIGEALIDTGFELPPTDVTLDGKPLPARIQTVVTDPFRFTVPADPGFEDDSAELGHPGWLWGSYAGRKALLPPLRPGTHVLEATARFGPDPVSTVDLTWTINVVA